MNETKSISMNEDLLKEKCLDAFIQQNETETKYEVLLEGICNYLDGHDNSARAFNKSILALGYLKNQNYIESYEDLNVLIRDCTDIYIKKIISDKIETIVNDNLKEIFHASIKKGRRAKAAF